VIRRSDEWVLGPRDRYQRGGDVPGVTFPTGAILDKETRILRIYYGIADTSVGLATADVGEILDYILSCPQS